MADFTPMMKQYLEIKEQNKDSILFYRLGDFYEMFFDDAKIASKELELVLTGKNCGAEERAPMCGVPYHSCESYIARLVARGYKVAICEQMTDPKLSKGLVERDIVRVITPGTVTDGSMLEAGKNNYMLSIFMTDAEAGLAVADVSTGEFLCTTLTGDDIVRQILSEAGRYSPKEAVLNAFAAMNSELVFGLRENMGIIITPVEENAFDVQSASAKLSAAFGDNGVPSGDSALCASGALYSYLEMTQRSDLSCFEKIQNYTSAVYMQMDLGTRRNLEITETIRKGERKGSLLWVLDKTKTSMGRRKLVSWIEKPLCSLAQIVARHDAVGELVENNALRDSAANRLSEVGDLERIVSRVSMKTVNARELEALCRSLKRLPEIKNELVSAKSALLKSAFENIDVCEDLASLLAAAIREDAPLTIREGGIIKRGFSAECDELYSLVNDSKGVLAQIEQREKEATGIPKLRVGYNSVFGYYIEVSNSYKNMVPDHYVRKQTLTTGERFITDELKQLEDKILSANERLVALEYDLFCGIRDTVNNAAQRIRTTAEALATLDVLCSYAQVAKQNKYTRPQMNGDGRILLKNSRHPVVERMLTDGLFVPNDATLDCGDNRMAIITGPNMAGKSTYMRQIAVIALMAQAGSFVPAASADLPIVDKIFTRIGAADDLSAGQSTFMVEMSEVAGILKNATSQSLIILDEIGRGTSTYDGMSIARAVVEYVADRKKIGAKTLFATHYHELTALEGQVDGVKNYNIAAKKRGEDIIFLRRILRGGTDESYGIEVARLAGVPEKVTGRAKEILSELISGGTAVYAERPRAQTVDDDQMSMDGSLKDEIIDDINAIQIDALTPIESMNMLYKLKQKAQKLQEE